MKVKKKKGGDKRAKDGGDIEMEGGGSDREENRGGRKRETRSILRRTTSTWAPVGSDADRKPEIEEKRRSDTKAIRRESSRACRRKGRARIGTGEQMLQRKMQNSSPSCRQFRSTFLCCSNRPNTCHEKLYWRIICIYPRELPI